MGFIWADHVKSLSETYKTDQKKVTSEKKKSHKEMLEAYMSRVTNKETKDRIIKFLAQSSA